ncbi:hypothetical protein [Bacillus sp. AK031]
MFVKIYQYHIQNDKVEEFLNIQEQVAEVYRRHVDIDTIYLQSRDDSTKWMEISKFRDEEEYQKSIALINREKEIQELFAAFQSLLLSEKQDIHEETFIEKKVLDSK